MASRGSVAKEDIMNKILEMFPGSFKYDKEIRIPYNEAGENLQIKCVLTCAKTNVENDNGEIPTASAFPPPVKNNDEVPFKSDFMNQPTDEEKQAVKTLVERLGIATN